MSSKEYRPRRARPAVPLHIVLPIALAIVTLGLFLWSGLKTLTPAPKVRVVQVVPAVAEAPDAPAASETEPVDRATKTVQAPGWIEPDPYAIAAVALADGVVEEILVLEGQSVAKDQEVARLVDEDARLSLRGAKAAVGLAESRKQVAEARLASAQADWDNPIELERVVESAGATVDELDARLEQLPFQIDEAQALLVSREQEAERLQDAADAGSASEIELIIAKAAAEAQASVVKQLERQDAVLRAQRARAASDLKAAQRALDLRIDDTQRLDSARAELDAAEAQLENARSALAEAELRVSRMTIRSPMDGLVLRRIKSPGDKVMMGMDDPTSAQIIHVYDPEKLQVRADVPLAEASHIVVGQRCEVFCEVLPDKAFEGVVTRITNLADLQRNTLEIKVRIIDPDLILKPEMLSRVRFLASSDSPGSNPSAEDEPTPEFLLPREAVRKGNTVLVVRERSGLRGRVDLVSVEVSESTEAPEGHVSVTGRLLSTDLVVLGDVELQPGALVDFSTPTPAPGSKEAVG
jgi:RND family efflux transporter MFP subunit